MAELNETIHQPVRLRIMAALVALEAGNDVDFTYPRELLQVTDLGAPLSHAAIVARELGIQAVVGCGNATMRLKTGDRVRVNGGQGIVEVV
jgi:phosphoenolpyruvate synthase/pyruvate phosphate dikinase